MEMENKFICGIPAMAEFLGLPERTVYYWSLTQKLPKPLNSDLRGRKLWRVDKKLNDLKRAIEMKRAQNAQ